MFDQGSTSQGLMSALLGGSLFSPFLYGGGYGQANQQQGGAQQPTWGLSQLFQQQQYGNPFTALNAGLDNAVSGIQDPVDRMSTRAAMKQRMIHGSNNQMGLTGQFQLPGQSFQQALENNGLAALFRDWGIGGGSMGGDNR